MGGDVNNVLPMVLRLYVHAYTLRSGDKASSMRIMSGQLSIAYVIILVSS